MKTRFNTLDEFYKALDSLIDQLKLDNRTDDATKLNDLIHHTAWTTGSELLGELQFVLKNMRGKYSKDLDEVINECYVFAVHYRKILGLH
ncbi:MAG TPA: hypothetical protein VF896_04965 [Anaerolineales bacterium]